MALTDSGSSGRGVADGGQALQQNNRPCIPRNLLLQFNISPSKNPRTPSFAPGRHVSDADLIWPTGALSRVSIKLRYSSFPTCRLFSRPADLRGFME
jgi:hypothetical protein